AQSGVSRSVPTGKDVSGSPAFPHKLWIKSMSNIPKLPYLYHRLKRLEQQLAELAARLDKEPET
ncbi:MAG: UDP-3-O-(3-hydroxymyristoyl)glucosamine N-acyltransferase, partial [Desulfobaccales bacterium]